MNIEEIYQALINDNVDILNIEECALASELKVAEVFNKISLLFATRYYHGLESYDNADDAMNKLWPLMLDYTIENNIELVEICYSVFLAFDEGEYFHEDNLDPVETYTKPLIAEILKEHEVNLLL